jgi:hypothetical protein
MAEQWPPSLSPFPPPLPPGSLPPQIPGSQRASIVACLTGTCSCLYEAEMAGGTEPFETGHNDRVTVVHSNFNGTKILTGSIDHRVKVWERDRRTGERTLLDTFTAHDADIRDVSCSSLVHCHLRTRCRQYLRSRSLTPRCARSCPSCVYTCLTRTSTLASTSQLETLEPKHPR